MANRYRVTGEQPVAGHQAGDELTDHDLAKHGVTPELKDALLEGGAIAPVRKQPTAAKRKAAAKPENTPERQEA